MKRIAWLAALAFGAVVPLGCAEKQVTTAKGFRPGQVWEYRVVKIEKNEERDLTTVLNIQAKDGWEYHSQITTDAHYLVFQRPTGQRGGHPVTGKAATATKTARPTTAPSSKPAPTAKEPAPPKVPEPDLKSIPEPDLRKIPDIDLKKVPEVEPVKPPEPVKKPQN
jgi:hypothetical protein